MKKTIYLLLFVSLIYLAALLGGVWASVNAASAGASARATYTPGPDPYVTPAPTYAAPAYPVPLEATPKPKARKQIGRLTR